MGREQRGEAGVTLIVSVALLALIWGVIAFVESTSCEARWRSSGFDSRWSVVTGCLVRYRGAWLPEDNVRLEATAPDNAAAASPEIPR